MLDKLLPKGFRDSLFKDSFLENYIVQSCISDFSLYGYNLLNPPLVEFEDSLLSNVGNNLKEKTFRFPDPLSNKMLAIRPDITCQIIRIVKYLLSKEVSPVRLSYFGDILHTGKKSLNQKRQLMQVGIEIIGVDTVYADSEVILRVLEVIRNLGIDSKSLCLDFSLPELAFILFEEYLFSKKDKEQMLYALGKKDFVLIEDLDKKYSTNMEFSILSKNNLDLEEIKKIKFSKKAMSVLQRLIDICSILKDRSIVENIIFDLLEIKNLQYNYGIAFSVFSSKKRIEIIKGGRYRIEGCSEYKEINGAGATLYVNELLKLVDNDSLTEGNKRVYVPVGNYDIKILEDLKSKGYKIINSLSDSEDIRESAKNQGCSYLLQEGNLFNLDS